MADITTASSGYQTGSIDTASTLVNNVSPTDAAHINGPNSAIIQIETVLGLGTTLIGTESDLASRLAVSLASDGHIDSTGTATITDSDSRTNTSDIMLTLASTTSGTPAAGIGTDILLQAESADENPSSVVQFGGALSDVTAGSEDSYFRVLLRVAGAALTECWRWAATGAFKGILTHANTADRTYILPDFSYTLGAGEIYKGPSSAGSGSTRSIETFTSATGNLSGIHFYSGNVTLNSGHTLTVPTGTRRLVMVATGTITINGTITAAGAGATGGALGAAGNPGTDQAGGGGVGAGGDVYRHGIALGVAGGAPGAGTQLSGSSLPFGDPFQFWGAASGGGGSDVSGGAGGGTIVLIAPAIVLANTATLNTSGVAGSTGFTTGSGGGGAGNIYIFTASYTDNGCTFIQTGGTGGAGSGGGPVAGGAGAAGIKQVNIYA